MDILTLKDCHFNAVIGVFPDERETKQSLILDIELGIDNKKAARRDNLEDVLDYRAVHELAKDYIKCSEHFLIETLAEKLAALILKEFRSVKQVTLTVKKPKPMQKRGGAWAGITITRSR
ncbi:MAG: dihydroneopterin aldolase [Patescibacteria group bacterium]|nr:dihydroneopterin aldolase [Patescibacteria group bacterium]